MKKSIVLLTLLLALPLTVSAKRFTAACLNVDGLPPDVGGIVKLNEGGPGSEGTKKISKLVSQKGWDFFSVSEAFNFNTELMSEISTYYTTGTFRGGIPTSIPSDWYNYTQGKKSFDTDGLNLLWRSNIGVSGEKCVIWEQRYGTTSDGADQMIAKGFRYYKVSVAPGLEIDVYILHMDAETSEKDNAAREAQMTQLVDMILDPENANKRPILIMGDTNNRYTRDNMKGLMFDRINADPRFEMHDPWVDIARHGNMPTIGQSSIMVPKHFDGTNHDQFQTGEVVDKVFYINNTDAPTTLTAVNYLHDTDFTEPDGSEISDHYPIVIDFDIDFKENASASAGDGEVFIRNVEKGLFVAAGHNYGTRGIAAKTGNRVTLDPAGADGKFYLKTTLLSNDGSQGYLGANLYMDCPDKADYSVTLNSETGYYTISSADGYLSIDGDNNLIWAAEAPDDNTQKWELLTQQQLIDELRENASESNPMDATFMIRGANFSRNDTENDKWEVNNGSIVDACFWRTTDRTRTGADPYGKEENYMAEFYHGTNTDKNDVMRAYWSLEQTINDLPAGIYKLTFQGFKREGNVKVNVTGKVNENGQNIDFWLPDITHTSSKDYPGELQSGIHYSSTQVNGHGITSKKIYKTSYSKIRDKYSETNTTVNYLGYEPDSKSDASVFFTEGFFPYEIDDMKLNGLLTIKVCETSDNVSRNESWTALDNFQLIYYGPAEDDLETLAKVKAAIDDAQTKAEASGFENYSNKSVVDAYDNKMISADGEKEIHNTYIALAKASVKETEFGQPMPYAILNNSFERGNLAEWTTNKATNGRVISDAVNGKDNTYLFAADKGEISYSSDFTMPGGVYTLRAMVTPGTVIKANGEVSAPAEGTAGELTEVSLKFLVSGGTAVIGAQNNNAFMVDNFVLTRENGYDTAKAYELVEFALSDVDSRIKNLDNGKWAETKAHYRNLLDTYAIEGNGQKEFFEIYGFLRARVFEQPANDKGEQDFTAAIINSSFETGTSLGWEILSTNGDVGVYQGNGEKNKGYYVAKTDGKYLLNCWKDGSGTKVSQTIPGLPAGRYKMTVMMAGDGKWANYDNDGKVTGYKDRENKPDMFLGANSQKHAKPLSTGLCEGEDISCEFDVAQDTEEVTIFVGDAACEWFKVDNFRLVRIGEQGTCAFYDRLNKALLATQKVVDNLPEKYQGDEEWLATKAKYDKMYELHLSDGHTVLEGDSSAPDPMHSNGEAEVADLYSALRTLIFSMTETEADMSGAIMNNGFELGELLGWDYDAPTDQTLVTLGKNNPPYTTEGVEGEYLYNTWYNSQANPISQTIPNVPAGKYKFSVKLASDEGSKFYIAVNDTPSEQFVVTKPAGEFDTVSMEFELTDEFTDITIGIYPTFNDEFSNKVEYGVMNGPWYKADDFRLELVGRRKSIDWTMETPSHGTIILPFDVEADKLAAENLEVYKITKSDWSDTPAEEAVNTYRILTFEKQDKLYANTPYVIKNLAFEPQAAKAKARRANAVTRAEETKGDTYTFTGMTTNKEDKYKLEDNLLTGTMVEKDAAQYEHHFQVVDGNVGFVYHLDADDNHTNHESIEPYHAYIHHPLIDTGEYISGFYFYEPELPIEWEMEGAHFGTIILPFDLTGEALEEFHAHGLKVYSLTAVGDAKKIPGNTGEYQIITREEVTGDLSANTPYMVMTPEAAEAATPKDPAKIAKFRATRAGETEAATAVKHIFSGAATNSEAAYTDGLLTGVFTTTTLDPGHRTLAQNEKEGGFNAIEEGRAEDVWPYHAYVHKDAADGDLLLFAEPQPNSEDSVDEILAGEYGNVDIYTVSGVLLRSDVTPAEALRDLDRGIYIFRAGDKSVKIFK